MKKTTETNTIALSVLFDKAAKSFSILAKADKAVEDFKAVALQIRVQVCPNFEEANHALSYSFAQEHDALLDGLFPSDKKGNAQFKRALKASLVACRYLGSHGDREVKRLGYLIERCNSLKISLDSMTDYQYQSFKKTHAEIVRKENAALDRLEKVLEKEKAERERIENERSLHSFDECHDMALIEAAHRANRADLTGNKVKVVISPAPASFDLNNNTFCAIQEVVPNVEPSLQGMTEAIKQMSSKELEVFNRLNVPDTSAPPTPAPVATVVVAPQAKVVAKEQQTAIKPQAPLSAASQVTVDGKYKLVTFKTGKDTEAKVKAFVSSNVQFNNWTIGEQAELVKQLLPALFEGFYLSVDGLIRFGQEK